MKATNDEINEMTDKAFAIIRDGLDSPDKYVQMSTAQSFVMALTMKAFEERIKAIERWADEIGDNEKK